MPGRQEGFSLLEVMISMLIMTIGMLGIAAMFTTAMTSFNSGSYDTSAMNAAYQKLNQIRMTDYSTLSSPSLKSIYNSSASITNITSDHHKFTLTWTTFQVYSGVQKVKVTVTWKNSVFKNNTGTHSIAVTALTSGKPTQ